MIPSHFCKQKTRKHIFKGMMRIHILYAKLSLRIRMKHYDPIWRVGGEGLGEGGGTAGATSTQALPTQPLSSVTWPEGPLWPQSLLGAMLWMGGSAREVMPPESHFQSMTDGTWWRNTSSPASLEGDESESISLCSTLFARVPCIPGR